MSRKIDLKFAMGAQLKQYVDNDNLIKKEVEEAIGRFLNEDWGVVSYEDVKSNRESLKRDCDYVLGAYPSDLIGNILVLRQYNNITVMMAKEY